MDESSGTHRDFGNMLNAKLTKKKPKKMPSSPWPKIKSGGGY